MVSGGVSIGVCHAEAFRSDKLICQEIAIMGYPEDVPLRVFHQARLDKLVESLTIRGLCSRISFISTEFLLAANQHPSIIVLIWQNSAAGVCCHYEYLYCFGQDVHFWRGRFSEGGEYCRHYGVGVCGRFAIFHEPALTNECNGVLPVLLEFRRREVASHACFRVDAAMAIDA